MERCNSSSPCLPAWCDVGRLVTSRSKHIFYKQKNQLLRHFSSNNVYSQYLIECQTLHFLTILTLWKPQIEELVGFYETVQTKWSIIVRWQKKKKVFTISGCLIAAWLVANIKWNFLCCSFNSVSPPPTVSQRAGLWHILLMSCCQIHTRSYSAEFSW